MRRPDACPGGYKVFVWTLENTQTLREAACTGASIAAAAAEFLRKLKTSTFARKTPSL